MIFKALAAVGIIIYHYNELKQLIAISTGVVSTRMSPTNFQSCNLQAGPALNMFNGVSEIIQVWNISISAEIALLFAEIVFASLHIFFLFPTTPPAVLPAYYWLTASLEGSVNNVSKGCVYRYPSLRTDTSWRSPITVRWNVLSGTCKRVLIV